MENEVKCRLCSSTNRVRHQNVTSDRGYHFDIEECSACNFQSKQSKIPVERLLSEVYGKLDFIERRAGEASYKPERVYVGTYIDSLAGKTRVLEVGPGAGGNLNYAKLKGHYCASVDVAEDNNTFYREVFDWDEVRSSWDEIENGSFDLVILTHVIEHIEDPLPFLQEAARVLAPGGEIILSTPNRGSLWALILGRRWWPYAIDDHFSFFQPKHFFLIAAACGLTKPKISTPNMMSFLTVYRAFRPVRIKGGSQKTVQHAPVQKGWKRSFAKAIATPIELLTLPFSWLGLGYEIVVVMARPSYEAQNG